jgi:flagellar biosynthesis/type III secretory pathway protein FliH
VSALAAGEHKARLLRWFGEDFDHPPQDIAEPPSPVADDGAEDEATDEATEPQEPVFTRADVELACATAEREWRERQDAAVGDVLARIRDTIVDTRAQAWDLVEDAARSLCALLLEELRRMLPGVIADVSERQWGELLAVISQALQPDLAVEVRIDPADGETLTRELVRSGNGMPEGLSIAPDEAIGRGGVCVTWKRGELRRSVAEAVACLDGALRLEQMG